MTVKKVSQVLNQAKESLKLLETLEKETLAKARTLVKLPIPKNTKNLTNDKILASLKKLGLATRAEVDVLRARVDKLEAAFATASEQRAKKTSTKNAAQPSAETIPHS